MKLIETTISETEVRMRYADNSDALQATQSIDIRLPLAVLKHGSGSALPHPGELLLSATQAAALRFVQELADAEKSRLVNLSNRRT